MERPPEFLKSFANRLAEVAASQEGTRLIRMLRLAGLFVQPCACIDGDIPDMRTFPAGPSDPDRVGIWERKSNKPGACFVRRMDATHEWNLWANIGRIDPKGVKRRIVLLGESVARGYLYDPLFTPAMALEKILESQLGQDEVEVVDLARTNIGADLIELAYSASTLEPDAIVIFAGNNWRLSFRSNPQNLEDLRIVTAVLRNQGVRGLKEYAEERLAKHISKMVRSVASYYESRGVPLVWIIPEFNLGDWREPFTNAPHLPGDANREWITYLDGARAALGRGELSEASELARRMIELDHGTNFSGLYVLAECHGRSGNWDDARRYSEMARDSVIWDPSRSYTPRSYSIMQETLRSEIGKNDTGLVDLPDLFKEYLVEGLPDRRLFMDYCHLNSEGIRIAMAAAAASLLRSFKDTNMSWRALAEVPVAPPREVEAEARFLAAIHNAHWYQEEEVVRYYCRQSVQSSPAIAQVMDSYIDLQTHRAPMLMCKSAEKIAGLGSRLLQHYLMRYNYQQLDETLLDSVVGSLKTVGIDMRERLDRLRREEHSANNTKINLLDYYYGTAGIQPQEVMWVTPRRDLSQFGMRSDYYKAYWLESRFVFIGESGRPVRIHLTCRLPASSRSEERILIEANGTCIGEALIGREWSTFEITIAGNVVRAGVNKILIRWPIPEFPGETAFDLVADDLSNGYFPEFFAIFGEIHAFVVSKERE